MKALRSTGGREGILLTMLFYMSLAKFVEFGLVHVTFTDQPLARFRGRRGGDRWLIGLMLDIGAGRLVADIKQPPEQIEYFHFIPVIAMTSQPSAASQSSYPLHSFSRVWNNHQL